MSDRQTAEAKGALSWQAPRPGARMTFLAVTSLYWVGLYLYVPVLPPYAEHMGGSLEMVGLVVSAYGLAQLLLRVPVGLWSDRLGRRKPFLALGFAATTLSCLGFVVAPDPWWMVGARFISGISACAWVVFSVLFASYFPPGRTTRAMSYITFCNSISVMGASYVGGLLANAYGWLAPFWASAGVGILGLLSMTAVSEAPKRRTDHSPLVERIRSVLRYRELVVASVVAALGQFTTFATIFGFVPTYAVGIGADKAQLGTLAMLGTLVSAGATLSSGTLLSPRLGPRRTVFVGNMIIAGSTAALPLIFDINGLYLAMIVAGLGRGMAYPILMGLAISRLPDREKATAMGLFQAVYAIGMFSGPVVAGWVGGQWGYGALFGSTAVVSVVTALVALMLPRADRSSSDTHPSK